MRNRALVIVTAGFLACAPVRAEDAAVPPPVAVEPAAGTAIVPAAAPEAATPPAEPVIAPAPIAAPVPPPAVAMRPAPASDEVPDALDDAAFDAAFQCPETLAGADSRIAELARYFAWAKDRHPDWNFRKRLDVRHGLLRRHACAVTLARMAASARPAFGR